MGNLTILQLGGGGITCYGLEFNPGGGTNLSSCFMLKKTGVEGALL